MNRYLLLLLLSGQSILAAQSTATITADSLARDYIARGEAPSVAVAIVRGNDTVLFAAYGKANLELDVDATTASVYRIGSVTKQFTAAAVIQLIEQGKVRLDDSIGAHLANLPTAWQSVTVRQLLNHTSGIPSYTALGAAWQRIWGVALTPDSILGLTRDKPMDFIPGSSFAYNNTGYVLLGMLVHRLTGSPWGSDLAARITRPLGLANTLVCHSTPVLRNRVSGYEKFGTSWTNTPYLAMSQPYAAGAICSTIGDMMSWNRALHTGKVVSAESYALMTTPVGAAQAQKYGFGLVRDTLAGREVITHGGGINGFLTANAWLPAEQMSVTVLTNAGSGSPGKLMNQMIQAALGVEPHRGPTATDLRSDQHDIYVGVYDLVIAGNAQAFTIASADSGLTGQLTGQQAIPLIHYGDHSFGAAFDRSLRLTFAVEDGRATGVTLLQGGMQFEGTRRR